MEKFPFRKGNEGIQIEDLLIAMQEGGLIERKSRDRYIFNQDKLKEYYFI